MSKHDNPQKDIKHGEDKAFANKMLDGIDAQLAQSTHDEPQIKPQMTGQELLQAGFKVIPSLAHPIIPQTGLVCLAGGSDTGKSSILRQLIISIVLGHDNWLGFKLNCRHNSGIYVSTEDDATATSYLLQRQAQCLPEALAKLRFLFDWEGGLAESLEPMLKKQPVDIVIIDCFSDVFGLDLKDTSKIRNYLNPLQSLSAKYQCLFVFLHHTGKRTDEREPSKHNLLGGQGLEAKMRLVMELRADNVNPSLRHLCIVKGNYLPAEFKQESYHLLFDSTSFTFTSNGERTPFNLLAKQVDDNGKAKYEQAKELKASGHSYEQIAPKIGYVSKGSVSKLFDKFENKTA